MLTTCFNTFITSTAIQTAGSWYYSRFLQIIVCCDIPGAVEPQCIVARSAI